MKATRCVDKPGLYLEEIVFGDDSTSDSLSSFRKETTQSLLGRLTNLRDSTIKSLVEFLLRIALLAVILLLFWWVIDLRTSSGMNLSIIGGGSC